MNIPSPRARRRARIEIIPLIDIMFFLLATFVMVSLSMVKNQGINVHLPSSSSSQVQERKEEATISVTEKGDLYWDKEAVGLENLRSRIEAFHSANPEGHVFINGDENAPLKSVVAVLDEVRKRGITKVAIQTKK